MFTPPTRRSVPPGGEPQRRSPSVDGLPPCDPRSPRTPTPIRGETSGGSADLRSPAHRKPPEPALGETRGDAPVEPPARRSDPLRHPPREEEGRWGESLGGLPLRKKKTGRLRADAQRIVVTRLLYRVHDPTEQPSRMQGF